MSNSPVTAVLSLRLSANGSRAAPVVNQTAEYRSRSVSVNCGGGGGTGAGGRNAPAK